MNELEYLPALNGYTYIITYLLPGETFYAIRDQCDDLVLAKRVARVFGGDDPEAGTGKTGAAEAA